MLSREDCVTQSVIEHVRLQLIARGYPQELWELVEPFNAQRITALHAEGKQLLAAGFNFDSPPQAAEMGSTLTLRQYHIEFIVFGTTMTWAKNLAAAIKFGCDADGEGGTIALLDYDQEDAPEIDRLVVLGSTSRPEPIADPEPWQEFVWLTSVEVEDLYIGALA